MANLAEKRSNKRDLLSQETQAELHRMETNPHYLKEKTKTIIYQTTGSTFTYNNLP